MNNKKIVISDQILLQNPLFWSGQGPIMIKSENPNIFLGIGVASPVKLSQGIPFDSLGFILSAEFVKRQITGSRVFLLIADQHAWLADGFDKNQALNISRLQFEVFNKVIKRFQLQNWQILTASKIFPKATPASYEQLEVRDVMHFVKHHQVGVKIGWRVQANQNHQTRGIA